MSKTEIDRLKSRLHMVITAAITREVATHFPKEYRIAKRAYNKRKKAA